MKKIKVYRTYSYGGMEGRDIIKRTFETIELAKENAKNDTWNDGFRLYEVVITFDGSVTEAENFIGEIACGRDAKVIEWETEKIAKAEARIEEYKANKRIKEATREKRIATENERIAWSKERIEAIAKKD